jgi:hypothetical protein
MNIAIEIIAAAVIVYFSGLPIVNIFANWKKDENE